MEILYRLDLGIHRCLQLFLVLKDPLLGRTGVPFPAAFKAKENSHRGLEMVRFGCEEGGSSILACFLCSKGLKIGPWYVRILYPWQVPEQNAPGTWVPPYNPLVHS